MADTKFYLRKLSDSLAQFTPGRRMFAGSRYSLVVDALEFAADTESAATACLSVDGARVADCVLDPDVLRRGVRIGTLLVPADVAGAPRLVVDLDGSTILSVDLPVDGWTAGGGSPEPRWTVVDLGQVSGTEVTVADMTQVRLAASRSIAPLSVVPEDTSGPFDAYLVVDAAGTAGFPFDGVLVGGAAPTWRHQDSFQLPASRWVLHVVKIAGVYFADLYAGRPAGSEVDPDGAVVVSAEVNS